MCFRNSIYYGYLTGHFGAGIAPPGRLAAPYVHILSTLGDSDGHVLANTYVRVFVETLVQDLPDTSAVKKEFLAVL